MSDLQTQGHELKCGRHSAMQVKKAKLRDLLGDFLGDALVLSRFTIVMYVLLLCFFWFGMAVWVSSAVVFFCCLWRPCGPALLLCFFFVWGGHVGQLCCCCRCWVCCVFILVILISVIVMVMSFRGLISLWLWFSWIPGYHDCSSYILLCLPWWALAMCFWNLFMFSMLL